MNRGDIVTLWDGITPRRLDHRNPDGTWHVSRLDDPTIWHDVPESMIHPVAPTFTAHARRTDPTPAHAVLLAHLAAGPTGLTGDELATALGRPYEAVGPRRPALRDAGWVEQVIGPDGKQVRRGGKGVWCITDAGVTAAHNIRRTA